MVLEDRRHSIAEVSELTGVPDYTLRRWEIDFPQLKPKRNRAGRRVYMPEDIEIVRRLKQLLWHEKMTTEGARRRLSEEIHGEGRPRTSREALNLIDKIEAEARAILDLLDSAEPPGSP